MHQYNRCAISWSGVCEVNFQPIVERHKLAVARGVNCLERIIWNVSSAKRQPSRREDGDNRQNNGERSA